MAAAAVAAPAAAAAAPAPATPPAVLAPSRPAAALAPCSSLRRALLSSFLSGSQAAGPGSGLRPPPPWGKG